MRQLRELAVEQDARRLCDALADAGIETTLIENQRGGFGVWVVEETELARAQGLSDEWSAPERTDGFEQAAKRGRARRELSARIEDRRQRQQELLAERMAQLERPRPALLTWGLIALSVTVYMLTEGSGWIEQLHQSWPSLPVPLNDGRKVLASLLIVDLERPVPQYRLNLLGVAVPWLGLPWDQPWRLVTPALLHFNLLHILFNLLWLRILGSIIELHHGARTLGLFTLLAAALPNILQLEVAQNPMFGGMSGVVYGMLGLVWMRGRLDPQVGYALSPGSVQFMLIWLALGFLGEFARGMGMTEIVGIANWCHLGGLLVGMAWGAASAQLARRRR
ncbi:MAG TPA: rhomboid family intramembrane serine protease [Polyangiales bacterium]